MKLTTFLSVSALLGVPAFAFGVFFDFAALPIFAAVTSVLVLLIGVSDYAPRRASSRAYALRPRSESIPLAA